MNNNYNNGYYTNPYIPNQNYYAPYTGNQNYSNQNYNQANTQYNAINTQQPTGFDFVNGIEEAKKYIVNPSKTMYLKDLTTNRMYIKKCDTQGRYSLQAYELNELNQEQSNDYVKKADFDKLVASVDNLSRSFETFNNRAKNDQKTQNERK